jgi:cell division protein FtsI (penicillin-binding protein 3)
MIAAYSAIINGGILYQPQIIKKIVGHNGTVVLDNTPKEIRRVISSRTSAEMRNIFVGVVNNGTGGNAKLDLITVGGKTGTSQKLVNGSYSKSKYNSSFIGFFPADNPKIICFVLVNSPEKGKYGGQVAAPIFRNIAQRIIKTDVNYFEEQPTEKQDMKVVFTSNKQSEQNRISSEGQPSKTLANDLTSLPKNKMPDLLNYSLRDGIKILSKLGIKFKVSGSGVIISQSIKAGEKISKGLVCYIDCKDVQIKGASVY